MKFESYYKIHFELVEASEIGQEREIQNGKIIKIYKPTDMHIKDSQNREYLLEREIFEKHYKKIQDAIIVPIDQPAEKPTEIKGLLLDTNKENIKNES